MCAVEPQKGVPQCGSPVGPAGIPRERDGSGTKNSECGTGRESRKESAFPQNSRNSRKFLIVFIIFKF